MLNAIHCIFISCIPIYSKYSRLNHYTDIYSLFQMIRLNQCTFCSQLTRQISCSANEKLKGQIDGSWLEKYFSVALRSFVQLVTLRPFGVTFILPSECQRWNWKHSFISRRICCIHFAGIDFGFTSSNGFCPLVVSFLCGYDLILHNVFA